MDAVAAEAARAKHHPEWSNVCLLSSTPFLISLVPGSQSMHERISKLTRPGLQHNAHPLDHAPPPRPFRG
jgi:hypothetical protein